MKRAIVVLLLLIANALFGAEKGTAPNTAPEARNARSPKEIAQGQLANRQSNRRFDIVAVLVPSTCAAGAAPGENVISPSAPALDTSAATTLRVLVALTANINPTIAQDAAQNSAERLL